MPLPAMSVTEAVGVIKTSSRRQSPISRTLKHTLSALYCVNLASEPRSPLIRFMGAPVRIVPSLFRRLTTSSDYGYRWRVTATDRTRGSIRLANCPSRMSATRPWTSRLSRRACQHLMPFIVQCLTYILIRKPLQYHAPTVRV
jgi:hypothetical protein